MIQPCSRATFPPMVEKPTAGRPASPNGGFWKNQRVRLVSPMFAAGEFRKYQPVTDNALGVLSSWWLWLDANFCVPLLRTFSGSDFRSPPFWEQLQGPNKSIAVLVTFCMTSFDSFLSSGLLKIEDWRKVNGLGHRANLHYASQRNFALSGISASYRRNRSGFFHW